jgi:hypothetical protein
LHSADRIPLLARPFRYPPCNLLGVATFHNCGAGNPRDMRASLGLDRASQGRPGNRPRACCISGDLTGRSRIWTSLPGLQAQPANAQGAALDAPQTARWCCPAGTAASGAQSPTNSARPHVAGSTVSGCTISAPMTCATRSGSLLLHEGRSVIYVARQLGHGAALTTRTYGHAIDNLEGQPQIGAEDAILAACRAGDVRRSTDGAEGEAEPYIRVHLSDSALRPHCGLSGRCPARTGDLLLVRQALYQLS